MNKNKSIHKCIYDMQKNHKEEYVDGYIVWVLLCTDLLRHTLFVDIHSGNRFFAVNILILFRWKKHMKHYSFILCCCIIEYKSFRHNLMRNDGFI